ncbi:MAG: DUF2752 domain-containing protein [Armatimonadetes bacterium]|nr:DUF2752 domain-containing protein [Armatimonadota bacterium]PIU65625.1 MAG: hypothetical protein COS85_07965 [Armatimonadetes bacterium CG07_land_8_20_14_0_80_59_28]PIX44082.1 MAG: hypothetical protein COZ56_05630 [Armatimonadetes bacterium CG_4_8_14_3_um_filter_58_9]PIY48012.1 MAG: hypothetical protein COZ05_04415 [Armatimonadetes bacterium CG_4_10_14_3_um_filter_59_10]PJB72512.1 MAG: hypothetical protein CO095_06810 [Armatimonadetes bacterium CG_4_9_14_3_um_filter_58_7]
MGYTSAVLGVSLKEGARIINGTHALHHDVADDLDNRAANPQRVLRLAAAVAILLSFLLNPDAVGVSLCPFKMMTSLPCPGCGLTRSLIALSHGSLSLSLRYHPFGIIAYLFLVGVLCAPLLPRRAACTAAAFLRSTHFGYPFTAAFIGYAVFRWLSIVYGPLDNIW